MAEVEFIYNGVKTIILCKINDKMKEVCQKFKVKQILDMIQIYFTLMMEK